MTIPKRLNAKADLNLVNYCAEDYWLVTQDAEDYNLVTSKIFTWSGNKHAPVLDLDVPHRLIESSTLGHAHLYIDVECDWEDYLEFLKAAAKIGLIEEGYYKASEARGFTSVRKPGLKKTAEDYANDAARKARNPANY